MKQSKHSQSLSKAVALLAMGGASLLLVHNTAFAHGESIRGGGSGSINAVGAGIVEDVVIGLRWDARRYELFSDQEMVDFRARGEDVHQHSREDAYFIQIGIPVAEDIDLAIMTQYNNFQGFKDNGDGQAMACFDTNGDGILDNLDPICISETDESPGWGDTLLMARYRFYNDGNHQWAGLFGLLMPTGKFTNKTDKNRYTGQDEVLGTHNQPGSGAFTVQTGIAYSGHLTDKLALDADWILRVNGPGANNFRSGNSWQADVALSYNHHAWITPVVELNGIFAKKDNEDGELKKNSGGDVVYFSPGINFKLNRSIVAYGNFSYPVYQNLGGISNDEKYRWSLGISYALGGGEAGPTHEHLD